MLDILLPVGLSFYTFQTISYSVDVYKQKISYDVDLLEYAFYITFFPLLFAGPITRTDTLVPQLRQRKKVDQILVNTGFWLLVLGLLKKGLVADYIAGFPVTQEFMAKLDDMVEFLVPQYQKEGKSQLVIAVGCTGGMHRSVFIAKHIYERLSAKKYPVKLEHRDLMKNDVHEHVREEC